LETVGVAASLDVEGESDLDSDSGSREDIWALAHLADLPTDPLLTHLVGLDQPNDQNVTHLDQYTPSARSPHTGTNSHRPPRS
jgi:hypothetical protein